MVDRVLFVSVCVAIMVGIIFSYSLSTYATLYYGYSEFHFFLRQLITGVFCICLMWQLSRMDPDLFIKKAGFGLFLLFMSLMVFMHFLPESMVTSAGGAKRWIRFPGFSLAPVEFFKVGFVFFLAWSFSRKYTDIKDMNLKEEFLLFLPYAGLFIVAVVLIAVMQNDLGQVVLLLLTFMFMLMVAGSSFKFFLVLLFIAFSTIISTIASSEHRILRIKQWWANAQDMVLSFFPDRIAGALRVENLPEPYQLFHSFNAIKNGELLGVGIGNGIIKLGFLSEVHTDIVLAGIAEEIGYLGLVGVTLLVMMIVYRMFRIANRSDNSIYHLFCIGVAMLIAFSFLINAFGISGITPVKGIAVPFISYGGSSLLAISIATGMVLSISKKARI